MIDKDKDDYDYCAHCSVEPPALKFKCPECKHNPDKEQIMIDGVDVSECIYLYSRWPNNLPHEACGLFHSDNPYDDDNRYLCKYNPNCYFKQLARKAQECEELKSESFTREELIGIQEKDIDRYRKALEEIEKKCKKLSTEWEAYQDETCIFNCKTRKTNRAKLADKILNIIDKAKGEGDE